MNRVLLVASLLALTCCAAPQSEEAALMDRIEQQVRMPEGARRITNYDRYYADAGDGKVIGLYLGASSDGERQWLADENRLLGVEDGGCGVVHVIFDQRAGKIEHLV
jgi:hypothetical protein